MTYELVLSVFGVDHLCSADTQKAKKKQEKDDTLRDGHFKSNSTYMLVYRKRQSRKTVKIHQA